MPTRRKIRPTPPASTRTCDCILALLHERSGHDFSLYRPCILRRRIERRAVLLRLEGVDAYLDHVRANAHELNQLLKELLIGDTGFFRDPATWDFLRDTVLPALLARHPDGHVLRAWVTACSSGEEAYSLAIVFKEALERLKPVGHFRLEIHATDLDANALDRAGKARYAADITADLTPERLARHFVADGAGYRVAEDIREMVIFAAQNVVSDPPLTGLDILCCRNLLIYFGEALQRKVLPLFHAAINPQGILVLGNVETTNAAADLFAPFGKEASVFKRVARGEGLLAN